MDDNHDSGEKRRTLDRFLSGNTELEELSARQSEFNVFRALRIETAEIRHSNTLAWLLDPSESHGLGDMFLRRVLSNILLGSEAPDEQVSASHVELMDFSDVEIRREEHHVDLLVIDHENKWVLLVENKINASEGRGQLARYREVIQKSFPDFRLLRVFLTLEGRSSDDEEAAGYIPYSYTQLLGVLEALFGQKKTQMAESVSVFLKQYIETIRRLTMRDEELVDLCKRIYRKHQEAIDLIVDYGKANAFETVVHEELQKHGQFEVILSTSSMVIFLPESWSPLVPDNGIMWPAKSMKRRVGIGCWFIRESQLIRLGFEVTAMSDPDLRLACVKALDQAGFELRKSAFADDAKYSRFFTQTHKVDDFGDEDKLRHAVDALLTKAEEQFPKGEVALKAAFGRLEK